MPLSLLGTSLGMKLLGHRLGIWLALMEIAKDFSKVATPILTPSGPHSHPHLIVPRFFIVVIFIGIQWDVIGS